MTERQFSELEIEAKLDSYHHQSGNQREYGQSSENESAKIEQADTKRKQTENNQEDNPLTGLAREMKYGRTGGLVSRGPFRHHG